MGKIKLFTHSYPVPLWFNGRVYRFWSRFIHKRGYHYAPREYPIGKHITTGLGNSEVKHWRHWCQWCGLRGETIEIKGRLNQ
jgi:hypothetical protein